MCAAHVVLLSDSLLMLFAHHRKGWKQYGVEVVAIFALAPTPHDLTIKLIDRKVAPSAAVLFVVDISLFRLLDRIQLVATFTTKPGFLAPRTGLCSCP